MISGRVTPNRDVIVELEVSAVVRENDDLGTAYFLEFIIDTGFSDSLTLPIEYINLLSLNPIGTTSVLLADNSLVRVEVYECFISWHSDQWKRAAVFVTEGDPLLGMALLSGSHLSIDVIENGLVTISPLP